MAPVLEAAGYADISATDAPADGYIIPGGLIEAALGISQPLVVQVVDGGLMLTAVGSGMTRGTALAASRARLAATGGRSAVWPPSRQAA
mgnify:CR=1 FL=1